MKAGISVRHMYAPQRMQITLYTPDNMCRNMPVKIYTQKNKCIGPSPLRTVKNINSNAKSTAYAVSGSACSLYHGTSWGVGVGGVSPVTKPRNF